MTRKQKFDAIFDLATTLFQAGQTMTFEQLRVWLNNKGFTSGWGNPYWTARGVARLVSCVWGYVANELGLGDAGAEPVKWAFTDQNGSYAFA